MVKKSKKKTKVKKIKAKFTGQLIYSNKQSAFALYEKSRFGEKKQGKIYYSYPEALYLIEKNILVIRKRIRKTSFKQLLKKLKKKDKRIEIKYAIFKDLRQRGYIVKTALKFGAEFRVYAKGIKPGQDHAKWILYPVRESEVLTWHEFTAKSRVAHSTRKNLLIGILDEEQDITYYEVKWTRP